MHCYDRPLEQKLNRFFRFPRNRTPKKMHTMHSRLKFKLRLIAQFLLPMGWASLRALGQCAGMATTPVAVSDCAARTVAHDSVATIDPNRPYTLAELIDIAERSNPRTRIAWERAKQRAEALGIEKSAYYPVLAGLAAFGDQRTIVPFPKPLAPKGYVMAELPIIQPEVTLQYLIFDFGKREGRVDEAAAQKIAAGANFIAVNQQTAFRTATAYYGLLTAQERLEAARETLKTAQTTQDAAEDRMNNGRATMPDVLNARAETAQAQFDLEAADGDEKIARVVLTETVGADPSPNILIDGQKNAPLPQALNLSIESLIDRAMASRPDLQAVAADIRAANDAIRQAKAAYRPQIGLTSSVAQTSIWPTADFGTFGNASEPTWSVALGIEWKLWDGGARRNALAIAQSKQRETKDEMTELRDTATREVWTAYIGFRTAVKKEQAATALLDSANTSYSASLDAYQYGVKNLVDVLTAEKQLAQARLSSVSARSQLFIEAVNLEFVTGNLLRNQPSATTPQSMDGQK